MATCSICLDSLGDRDKCKTICNHSFHTSCLLIWINENSNCPMCRHKLIEKKPEIKMQVYRDPLDSILDTPMNPSSFTNYMG